MFAAKGGGTPTKLGSPGPTPTRSVEKAPSRVDAKWKSIPLGIEPKIEILYVGVMFHLGFSSISGEGTLCILKYAQTHTYLHIYYIFICIYTVFFQFM